MKNAINVLVKGPLSLTILFLWVSTCKAQFNSNLSSSNCNFEDTLILKMSDSLKPIFNANSIESNQKIVEGVNVKYLATDRIRLTDSFRVDNQSNFKAAIVQKCGSLEDKIDTSETLKVNCSFAKQDVRSSEVKFDGYQSRIKKAPQCSVPEDALDVDCNPPKFAYFWNFGDGNYKIIESVDTLELDIEHTYNLAGSYDVSIIRSAIKLPDEDSRMLYGKPLSNIGKTNITMQNGNANFERQDSLHYCNEKEKFEDNDALRLVPIQCNIIAGELLTFVATIKNTSNDMVDFAEAKLTYDPEILLNGHADIYYCDTEGTESCNGNLSVNMFDIGSDKQRNFFTYFKVHPDLEYADSTRTGDSFEVCLELKIPSTRKIDTFCNTYKIGDPHDPSYKLLLNEHENSDKLDFMIHMENDGDQPTRSVKVYDYFDPPLPCINIDSVMMIERNTKCYGYETDSFYEDTYEGFEKAAHFEFDNLMIRGLNEIPQPPIDSIKDEFTFTLKLTEPILDPTYWCNKADIVFDEEPPYTIETCFYNFGKNHQFLNEDVPETKVYVFNKMINEDSVSIRPTLFANNLYVNADMPFITLQPDLSELPENFVEDLEYVWYPNQETTPTITVCPTENTLYRVHISWMQNDTMCFATDYVLVETQCFYGCTDSTATNYDRFAQCDDGSCRHCIAENDDSLFDNFTWLSDSLNINKEECNAESIKVTHYIRKNNFNFVAIDIDGNVNYYLENGDFWYITQDEVKTELLNQVHTVCIWECEGQKRTLCDTYPWLSSFNGANLFGSVISSNNMGYVIKAYQYYNNPLLYITVGEEDEDNEDEVNITAGILLLDGEPYCIDDGDENCVTTLMQSYNLTSIKSWPCQPIDCSN